MDEETFNSSGELVDGVIMNVFEYLFKNYDTFDKEDILDSCDSAIQEIESWKKVITSNVQIASKGEKHGN